MKNGGLAALWVKLGRGKWRGEPWFYGEESRASNPGFNAANSSGEIHGIEIGEEHDDVT